MRRLTITLSESRYRALKRASVSFGKTMGELIDESLENYGIKIQENVPELLQRARTNSNLTETQAQKLANKHIRANRSQ